MDDLAQFKHLQGFLAPITNVAPCGEDLDGNSDEEYMRIERDIEQANESREWKKLKKDIQKILSTTKDLRLLSRFSRTLLQTEKSPIEGLVQGLYLTEEYIDKYWDCVYPPEDKDDPDEKFADRINAVAEFGSWSSVVLPLRKKCPLLSFNGMDPYFLEDLVSFQKGDVVADKQPPKDIFDALSPEEKKQVDVALEHFITAQKIADNIKELLLKKTEIAFIDFDTYLLPNLQEGISALSELSPNAEKPPTKENNQTTDTSAPNSNIHTLKNSGSVQSRDDVIKLLDMICNYYETNEPSSPIPLLLKRAKGIVHKDFLEVLEELVPDSVSMTEPVFGRTENNSEEY
ncbi:MAG: type VI secretion system ImpA family N-terminal domain-containing protein [Cocleimonas sp.]|nr:type VI secretion system ImpA family N-terminal domain-containing protein [Cocleimonas sp.]